MHLVVWRQVTPFFLALFTGALAFAQPPVLVMSDGTVTPITEENRLDVLGIPNKSVETVVAHGITWNLDYQDSPGVGFYDTVAGNARRATLAQAINYVSDVINQPGGVVDLTVMSVNVNSGMLASAGPLVSGFLNNPTTNNGAVFKHILNGGVDPIPGFPDGKVQVNFFWNYTLGNGSVAPATYDLLSVLIHELTHALGLLRSIAFLEGSGQTCESSSPRPDGTGWFGDTPGEYAAWDTFLRTGNNNAFVNGSFLYVGNASYFTGGDGGVFFAGPQAVAAYGTRPPVYAPPSFQCGSSLSHWQSGIGAVMEPSIAAGVARRTYAAFEIATLRDLGYTNAADPNLGGGDTPPSLVQIIGPGVVEENEPFTFSLYTEGGSGTFTYQWFKDGAPIPGETQPTFSRAAATNADAGFYVAAVSAGAKATTQSAPFYLQVVPAGMLPLAGDIIVVVLTVALIFGGPVFLRLRKSSTD